MARNTWDSSRDNNDAIMRRGDDRTIDYGRGGDTRRGNEYRNSQWRNGSDSYRSADREEAYIEDRDMSYADRDRARSNSNLYESSRFAHDRYTGTQDRDAGMFSRDSQASSRTTYGHPAHSQSHYGQGNYGQANSGQSNYGGQNFSQSSGQQYGSTPWSASNDHSNFGSQNYASTYGSSTYGSHTGKGPKGYRRSDDRIKEEVSDALERHPHIDASELEVDVKDGVVTLRGHVEERRIKRMAEDAVENLSGVRDVRNELMVDQSLFQRAKEAIFGSSLDSETASSQTSKPSQGRSKH